MAQRHAESEKQTTGRSSTFAGSMRVRDWTLDTSPVELAGEPLRHHVCLVHLPGVPSTRLAQNRFPAGPSMACTAHLAKQQAARGQRIHEQAIRHGTMVSVSNSVAEVSLHNRYQYTPISLLHVCFAARSLTTRRKIKAANDAEPGRLLMVTFEHQDACTTTLGGLHGALYLKVVSTTG